LEVLLQCDNEVGVKPVTRALLATARASTWRKLTRFFIPVFWVIHHWSAPAAAATQTIQMKASALSWRTASLIGSLSVAEWQAPCIGGAFFRKRFLREPHRSAR